MMEHSLLFLMYYDVGSVVLQTFGQFFPLLLLWTFHLLFMGGGKLQRAGGGYLSVRVIVTICYTSRTAQILTQETTFPA